MLSRCIASSIALIAVLTFPCSELLAQRPNEIRWVNQDLRVRLDETFVNNVNLDMLGYARDYAAARGGDRNTVSVFIVANNAYGWRMKYQVRGVWQEGHFYSMLDVARWQGQKNYGNRVRNYGIYFTTFNSAQSWRAAYILYR